FILVRFHHGGTFTNPPDTKYVTNIEVNIFSIDQDHFSLFKFCYYTWGLGYHTIGVFYVFNPNTKEFVLMENGKQLYNIGCHCTDGELNVYVLHVIDEVVEIVVPAGYLCGLEITQDSS
ncbi:hypothetical protein A4A49_60543, partial [Nicotiana attenuata]